MNIQVVAYGKQKTKEYVEFAGLKSGQSQLRNFEQSLMRDFFFGVFFFCVLQSLRSNEKTKGEEARSVFFLLPLPDHFLA